MRILFLIILISGWWSPPVAHANETPTTLPQIIADLKAGQSIVDKKFIVEGLDFAEESTLLTKAGKERLNQLVQQLGQIPTVNLEVISHTDKQSEKSAGRDLTRKRAKNISDHLILKGIPYQRVFYTGMGARELLTKKSSERVRNNRVEIRITGLQTGSHQIIPLTGNPIAAKVIILTEDQVLYRESESSSNQSLAITDVNRLDFAFGKSLQINNLDQNQALATANTKVKNTVTKKPKTTPVPKANTPKPARTVPKVSLKDANKKPAVTSVEQPAKKKTIVPPAAKRTAPTVSKKQVPSKVKPTTPQTSVSTEMTAKSPNPMNSEALFESSEMPKSSTTPATSKTVEANPTANKVGGTNPNPQTPVSTNPKPNPLPAPTEVIIADDAAVESILARYLDNYVLQPRELPKKALTSEELFAINARSGINTEFATQGNDMNSLAAAGTTTSEAGGFTSVAENKSGWVFQLVRQPLGVEGANLGLNYVDASEQEVRVVASKALPDLAQLLMGSVGFMYHADNAISYQLAFNFGGKEGIGYRSINLGGAYRLEMGRLQLLSGAKIEYGAGRFNLTNHELRTNIFTVKNTEFISESVAIDYRENLTSITPQLGLGFKINNKFDLLVQGGYAVNLLTIGKLRFTGGTENSESKTVRDKLDNAGLSVNGTTVMESAKLFGVRGVGIQAGIVWKMY
ncbi:MAG: OmpA family protein [Saprospiraceae bacterium]